MNNIYILAKIERGNGTVFEGSTIIGIYHNYRKAADEKIRLKDCVDGYLHIYEVYEDNPIIIDRSMKANKKFKYYRYKAAYIVKDMGGFNALSRMYEDLQEIKLNEPLKKDSSSYIYKNDGTIEVEIITKVQFPIRTYDRTCRKVIESQGVVETS